MYQSPEAATTQAGQSAKDMTPEELQEHFDDFYEDIYEEFSKYGDIEDLHVCDNLADHLVGNVYVKYKDEDSAHAAMQGLSGRYYCGRPILAEFSPVTDFKEATCRQYEENTCTRGGYCNFMHLKPISRQLRKRLFGKSTPKTRSTDGHDPRMKHKRRSRSRSRSRRKHKEKGKERERSKDRSKDKERDHKDRDRSSREREGNDEKPQEEGDLEGGEEREHATARGMSEEERRAMFARWNEERRKQS